MAASATLAVKAGACVRRTRLVMVAPDLRHPRRSQAEIPLIDLSEFGQPPLLALKFATKPYRRSAMTTAVDKWPASARLLAVATAGHLPTALTPLPGARPRTGDADGGSNDGNGH